MIREFKNHVKKYNMKDKRIFYKFYHSFDTMKICVYLAKKLKLNKDDIKLAKELGLLHDIGRFEQIKMYNSMNDKKFKNHGLIGVNILFDENYLKEFNVDPKHYDIIKVAIINHAQNGINNGLSAKELLFCKLIRDADKIAIFKVIDKFLNDSNGEVTEELKNEFYRHLKVNFDYVKTNADDVVKTLSYAFDINYQCSFKYLKQKRILKNLEKKINNPKLNEYFNEVNKYIDERISENNGN
jgi:putative nucleotidyltransferase with HDIG domain